MGGRLKAGLLLVVMYGFGLLTGLAWERSEMGHRPGLHFFSDHRLHHFYQELDLTPDQQKQMDVIFSKAHERATQINEEVSWDLAEIHRDSIDSIQTILTPDQRIKFEAIHHRMDKRRHFHHPLAPPEPGLEK